MSTESASPTCCPRRSQKCSRAKHRRIEPFQLTFNEAVTCGNNVKAAILCHLKQNCRVLFLLALAFLCLNSWPTRILDHCQVLGVTASAEAHACTHNDCHLLPDIEFRPCGLLKTNTYIALHRHKMHSFRAISEHTKYGRVHLYNSKVVRLLVIWY